VVAAAIAILDSQLCIEDRRQRCSLDYVVQEHDCVRACMCACMIVCVHACVPAPVAVFFFRAS
jgi:hypothetical protein